MHRFRLWTFDPPEFRTQRNRLLPIEGGDGSTLSLDFTTGVLDPRLTFTRAANTATVINSSGLVQTVNANTPRFDHDPTTLEPKGLLIEGSATNLMTYSEAFTPDWTDTNITRDGTLRTSPDGTADALRVTASAGNATIIRTSAIGTSSERTFSVWLRRVTGTGNVQYTQDNGTNWTTQAITSSWVRYNFTHTVNHQVGIRIVNSGDAIELWGAQLETGSGASSYIPTGASTVTRNADKMSMTNITSMQWNQTAGTFYLHMDVAAETNTINFSTMMGMYTATPVRVVRFLLNNSSGTNPRISCNTWTTVPEQILSSLITRSTAPTVFKYAAALSNTGQALSHVVNNGSVTTVTGTGTLQTPTRLLWHQDPSAGDTEYFPVHIRSMKYWPTNLPDATLKSLTT